MHDASPHNSRSPWNFVHANRQRSRFSLALSLIVMLPLFAGCDSGFIADLQKERAVDYDRKIVAGGDAARGLRLVASGVYGCPACHRIEGVEGANGIVGPALNAFAERTFIAGVVPNTPAQLVRYLKNPPGITPASAMPDLGLSEAQARDIAAYLYTLDRADDG